MKRRLLLILGLVSVNSHAELSGQSIALNCFNCHNRKPAANSAIPSLSDYSQQRLQQAMLDFKYDKTNATLMPRIAKAYSDAEISAVAAYLSQQ
jgi:sulfide dehydrogenase cytochrome subunit